MKLTRYTDYALRILLQLGRSPNRLQSIHDLSVACNAPENHVMKVTPTLVRGGLAASARGRGGGMKLAKTPDQISVGEVVRLTEGPLDVGECNDCLQCNSCHLPNVLENAGEAFLLALDKVTLADILASGDPPSHSFGDQVRS